MKRFAFILLLSGLGLSAAYFAVSCSSNPTTPGGFQAPLQTVVAINPSWTPTFTSTPTLTFTPTATPTVTHTPTPFVSGTLSYAFNRPAAVAVDANGNVYVADENNNKVERFTSTGALDVAWGNGGKGKGLVSYTSPTGVAVDGGQNLYVVGGMSGVTKFDKDGNFLAQFTGTTFSNPSGVAVDGSGDIYVSDTGNSRIVQLNAGGALSGFGGGGTAAVSSSVTLAGLAFNANDGNVYAATQGTAINGSYSVILGFNPSSGGAAAVTVNGFKNPGGVAFDAAGNLFVADTGNRQVEEFFAGNFAGGVPNVVFNDGGLLKTPLGVAVAGNGDIYVADTTYNGGNGSVVKFAP